ncbi:aspartic peptidase domain-containing protein [Halteromyces radiatus]|uniref:aspartic peptidase domain-containing protein n=1 Tax=Halteromyces radiatus TaxID=101107 RepID=UPI00221E61DA|nr:aspartic peptidase domain-containing protein [Halteromyces radiatus]KAI8096745.1 aspartic peptidase domain-containing protein [Halteromyces radiatus]
MILLTFLSVCILGTSVIHANDNQQPSLIRLPFIEKTYPTDSIIKRDGYQNLLYNSHSSQYLIHVDIGTPGQTFAVTLDTGSGDLWVPSTDCPSVVCPVPKFNPTQSSTYNNTTIPFKITYGLGSANGTYIKETVTIGGAVVKQQQLGLAIASSNIFTRMTALGLRNTTSDDQVPASGILGLGYPGLTSIAHQNGSAYNPFVFNLLQQNLIQNPIFSIYLNNAQTLGWSGEVIFGGIDNTKYSGSINYVPVQQTTAGASSTGYMFWTVLGQGFNVIGGKGNTSSLQFSSPVPSIIDTGTTLSYLPLNMVKGLMLSIFGPGVYQQDVSTGMFMVDCAMASESNVTVQFQMTSSSSATNNSAAVINVALTDMILQDASGCYLAVAPSDDTSSSTFGPSSTLIGQSILRSAYMVFDMQQNRIGFAQTIFTSATNNNNSNNSGGSSGGGKNGSTSGSSIVNLNHGWNRIILVSVFVYYLYLL